VERRIEPDAADAAQYDLLYRRYRALRGYLDHFWDQALAAYKTAVERQARESS